MIVRISADGTVRLDEPDVFTAFAVQTAGSTDAAGDALAAAGVGVPIPGESEVGVSVDWVRREIADAGVADGDAKLDGMISYARSKGWMDDEAGTIRSHVEA